MQRDINPFLKLPLPFSQVPIKSKAKRLTADYNNNNKKIMTKGLREDTSIVLQECELLEIIHME